MAIGTFKVNNFQAWGDLVKSWSKNGAQSWPTTIQELVDQCSPLGVGAQIDGYETIRIVQAASETELLLRVPPRANLVASEAALNGGGNYAIPYFYKRLFNQANDPVIPQEQKMQVHAERIGDYTMALCT